MPSYLAAPVEEPQIRFVRRYLLPAPKSTLPEADSVALVEVARNDKFPNLNATPAASSNATVSICMSSSRLVRGQLLFSQTPKKNACQAPISTNPLPINDFHVKNQYTQTAILDIEREMEKEVAPRSILQG
jgi:hypothetical protein